jgi:GWxTD domain-containing protein
MRSLSKLALILSVGVLPLSLPAHQRDTGLVLRAVRFYRADQDRTRIKGLIQIPFSALQPGPGGQSVYAVSVSVADSTGLALYQQSWQSRAHHSGASDAYTVEIVDFVVAPGKYRLVVAVQDSTTGRKLSTSSELQALSDSTLASDLLVAPGIRLATASDTMPRPGEFRTGNNLITASARVLLTPLRSVIFYLLEAYAEREIQGSMSVAIRDAAGAEKLRTQPLPVTVDSGGSVLKGQLDLVGLPPGNYVMVADIQLGGRTIQRSADFTMVGLTETLARDSSRRAAELVTDEGYFGSMSREQLDEARAPLEYIAERRELSAWSENLSVEAKRRFLTQFWKTRDPSPRTGPNERRESFYAAIAEADREFKEGGRSQVPGWRTDRGRIFAKNGRPDEVLRRQQEGRAPPYEIWSYAKGKGYYYIFADRSGFGAYTLIHSNDLEEVGLPGWGDILGRPAIADARRFLGVDLLESRNEF